MHRLTQDECKGPGWDDLARRDRIATNLERLDPVPEHRFLRLASSPKLATREQLHDRPVADRSPLRNALRSVFDLDRRLACRLRLLGVDIVELEVGEIGVIRELAILDVETQSALGTYNERD